MKARVLKVGKRALPVILPLLVGAIGAWLGLLALGTDTVRAGSFAVELTSKFGRGETVVRLPPLGEMRLDTHVAPLGVRATLVDVDIERLTEDLREKPTRAIVDEIESDARSHIRPYALRLLGVAAAGGLATGLIVFRRRWRDVAAAAVAAVVLVGVMQALAWATFRPQAFAEPRFVGTLQMAPQLLGSAEELTQRIDRFRANLERIVGGAVRAYAALEPQAIGSEEEVRVLHISDIHLNTMGLDFAVQIARGFGVDAIVDTGDLTSFGTPLEETIVSQLPRFGRPYLFVRGNHDSPAVSERIEATPNGVVLDGTMEEVAGLRFYGLAHPVFTEDQQEAVTHPEFEERARDAGRRILSDIEALEEPPHVVVVHDDRMAEAVAGRVPVVLSGHYHRARARVVGGTMYLRAGSTGGAGVNMFTADPPVPLSATLLYFERGPNPALIAYDLIEQSPTTGRLVIQRHLVADAPESTLSPEPTP